MEKSTYFRDIRVAQKKSHLSIRHSKLEYLIMCLVLRAFFHLLVYVSKSTYQVFVFICLSHNKTPTNSTHAAGLPNNPRGLIITFYPNFRLFCIIYNSFQGWRASHKFIAICVTKCLLTVVECFIVRFYWATLIYCDDKRCILSFEYSWNFMGQLSGCVAFVLRPYFSINLLTFQFVNKNT